MHLFSVYRAIAASLVLLGLPAIGSAAEESQGTPAQVQFYELKVRPILEQHCLRCHGNIPNPKGGLRLTSRPAVLRGGDSGPAIDLKDAGESLLVQAINYSGYEMPPAGKLPADQIQILTEWVKQGLPWSAVTTPEPEVSAKSPVPLVNDETKKFWSFQKVVQPSVPEISNERWSKNPIDRFVFAKLQTAGLEPNPRAEREALLRRAYYDLIGLPPQPEEVNAFLSDASPGAWEKVVDRLLDSPHYGERWGRHWLDLVRYAETNSYERDGAKPFVWRYRDYVIRSFNEDKPYDEFIREQLAGDELTPASPDRLIATGFYRLGIWDDEPADPEQALYDDLDDIVQTAGQVFLGLTIGCARCHDHKLDPIPQRDYYKFLSFFRNVRRFGVRSHESVLEASVRTIATEDEQRKYAAVVQEHKDRLSQVETELQELEKKVQSDLVGVERDEFKTETARLEIVGKRVPKILTEAEFDQYRSLTEQRKRLRETKPPGLAQALCVTENGRAAPATHLLIRGNPHSPGDPEEPGFLEILSPPSPQLDELPADVNSCGRRLALAKWIASPANPLTARVMVNRVWQFHFGRGLVRSSSDFGFQGTKPTHPELLDWLAVQFVEGDWRLKRLHKQIMLSETYQISSRGRPQALEIDPENNLFWRSNMRRLSAEEIRDSILAVNGSLNRSPYAGPSVFIKIPDEVLAGQSRPGEGWGESSREDQARRSIFVHVKRSLIPPILASFDAADPDSSCPIRFATTQPTQALGLLNSQFLQEQSRIFAEYLSQQAPDDVTAQIRIGLERALQRAPTDADIQRAQGLLKTIQSKHGMPQATAMRHLCLTIYNLNEFLYLD